MRHLLIMNPGSCGGHGARHWSYWERELRSHNVAFETVRTTTPGDAIRAARNAGDFETVVAVGGDGTINEVLDGLVQSGQTQVDNISPYTL